MLMNFTSYGILAQELMYSTLYSNKPWFDDWQAVQNTKEIGF